MKNGSIAKHIGSQIRRRRVHLHISQEALGLKLDGLTQQAISKMERGGEVSGTQFLQLSQILNVPVNYFFDGLEPAAQPLTESPREAQNFALHA